MISINKKKNNSVFPYRELFGKKQLLAVKKVFERSWKLKQDHGYNDYYEDIYTKQFVKFLNTKGYADAVNSGTSALFAILNSLNIDKKKKNSNCFSCNKSWIDNPFSSS